ncbi:NUMOD4 motif-containing HNH endonuclease [uncultured Corynebacterium sp.]|uniref:NUMOD4 motif-containing HNH endonuclease n=1 Tax=uncultured Corynebacterium sp. TaxID=159447 RepID=UPI00338FF50D
MAVNVEAVWHPVQGYEGLYEVSNAGGVRGVDRTLSDGRRWKGRALKMAESHNGHLWVMLAKNGAQKRCWVHRLVLEAFVCPRPDGMEGCHNNGDPKDNRVENLRWDARSNNAFDRVLHGRHENVFREVCPRGHKLELPNLKPADYERGWRNCLACARAKNYVYTHQDLKERFKEIADRRYEDIMKSA